MDSLPDKILIVEDESELRFSIREFLEEQGYEVFEAISVKEAFSVVETEAPHLVLLDIYLGSELGLDLPIWVAKSDLLYRKPKFLVMSGTVGGELMKSESFLEDNQVHRFLKKPFDFQDLQRDIQDLLNID